MTARPFISYAREDQATAKRLYADLKSRGADPWMDAENLLGGDNWAVKIRDAVRKSTHFIALVSHHFVNKRGFVQKELRHALSVLDEYPESTRFVIPVRLDSTEPRHERLRELHWIDFFPSYDAGFSKLAAALELHSHESVASLTPEETLRRSDDILSNLARFTGRRTSEATLITDLGAIRCRFLEKVAPNHVANFIALAKSGFFDGTAFHRVIPEFIVQGGDPNTRGTDRDMWGRGGSDKRIAAEFSDTPHRRGVVSMARASDPNSASSQFFICVADSLFLDRQYSVFAEVVSGMEVVDKIVAAPRDRADRPLSPTRIHRVVLHDGPQS